MERVTDSTGTIEFDTSSGISLEEQKEILAGINAMTGGKRLVGEASVTAAKKKGFVFPLFVNVGAVAFLGLGFLLLSHLHTGDEQVIRESSANLGVTEQKLIEAKVLELSQSQTSLSFALEELSRLGSEQDRIAMVESQMGGFFAAFSSHMAESRFDDASATCSAMREFVNAPSLRGISVLDSRRQTNLTAIAAMEQAVAEARRLASLGGMVHGDAVAELRARNEALEEALAASDASAEIAELRTARTSQQETLNRRDSEITALRSEAGEKDRQIAELNTAVTAVTAQRDEAQRQRDEVQQRMEAAIRAFTGE